MEKERKQSSSVYVRVGYAYLEEDVNNRLRNRIGDQWMNDYLVTHIEKYVVLSVDNEYIMQRFQHMKTY